MTEGQLLGGRYRLERLLGEGGMGQVWQARDEALARPVAVKVISLLAGGGTRGDEARARFLREARITAGLQHANIVTVHDLGESGEGENRVPFLVMELVRGEGLDAVLRRGAVAPALVAQWSAEICDALAAAHEAGIMHRDIKPSNVLVTPSGSVKVLDFGVARAADPSATGDRLTRTGFIVGTPPYMAPEQARGFPEPASDLYAVGCLIFELLTGRLPFQAPDTVGYLTAHLTEEPPAPGSVAAGIPAAWDDLVLTLLRKEPARRYPDAGALARALRHPDLTPGSTIPATTAEAGRTSTAPTGEAVKRFGLPAVLLVATLIAFPDPAWLTYAGSGFRYISLTLMAALLGCASALTPRAGNLLRTTGYVTALLNAANVWFLVLGIDAGRWTNDSVWAYGTVVALALATYAHRDVTTRRAVTVAS
ncbi:serine/threonine-protein kinase [Streptomyces sp. NPDC049555]|uniref:serine/threonine-protein kinase n=1 Tax=Streptomyces sp. NPDC049555 TaxID=3154930 RepID=UPI0034388E12